MEGRNLAVGVDAIEVVSETGEGDRINWLMAGGRISGSLVFGLLRSFDSSRVGRRVVELSPEVLRRR